MQPLKKATQSIGVRDSVGGFTLLELLVAISIFSILATVLFLSIGAVSNGVSGLRNRMESQQAIRQAFQRISEDLGNLYYSPENSRLYFEGQHQTSKGGRRDQFEFTSNRYHWGEKRDELVTVRYSTSGGSKGISLMRSETPMSGAHPASAKSFAILEGLKEVSYAYIDSEKKEHQDWSSNSKEGEDVLPKALRISIKFQGAAENDEPFTTLIPIPIGLRPPSVIAAASSSSSGPPSTSGGPPGSSGRPPGSVGGTGPPPTSGTGPPQGGGPPPSSGGPPGSGPGSGVGPPPNSGGPPGSENR